MEEVNIFWFRRDLRLYDNSGLSAATHSKNKVIPIFIFDTSITDKLPNNDRRINFIFDNQVDGILLQLDQMLLLLFQVQGMLLIPLQLMVQQ